MNSKKYNFIITKSFLGNQKDYFITLTEKEKENYVKLKNKFQKNIFNSTLQTHKIYENNWIKVFSSYINKKDRIIFFYKNLDKIYLYKIIKDHDYWKLLSNIKYAMNEFLKNF